MAQTLPERIAELETELAVARKDMERLDKMTRIGNFSVVRRREIERMGHYFEIQIKGHPASSGKRLREAIDLLREPRGRMPRRKSNPDTSGVGHAPVRHEFSCSHFRCPCGTIVTFSPNSRTYQPLINPRQTIPERLTIGDCPVCGCSHYK